MIIPDSRQIWEVHFYVEPVENGLSSQKPLEITTNDGQIPPNLLSIKRFWDRRKEYWPNFDDGIITDKVGLFSVTPWDSAVSIAHAANSYYPNDSPFIIDTCCGVGGNSTAFAAVIKTSVVIGCDLSSKRINFAKHNGIICGLKGNADYVRNDSFKFLRGFRNQARFVFADPPWGGPGYQIRSFEDLPYDIHELAEATKAACVNSEMRLVLFMPRNFPVEAARTIAPKGTVVGHYMITTGPANREIAACFLYGKPSTKKNVYKAQPET